MSGWRITSAVFNGGTEEIKRLIGKRVRTKRDLLDFPLHDPARPLPGKRTVPSGAIGFVANPYRDGVLLAFPDKPGAACMTLDALARQHAFYVVFVNQPTFKSQFEIEA